jgi:hypothetical protein
VIDVSGHLQPNCPLKSALSAADITEAKQLSGWKAVMSKLILYAFTAKTH